MTEQFILRYGSDGNPPKLEPLSRPKEAISAPAPVETSNDNLAAGRMVGVPGTSEPASVETTNDNLASGNQTTTSASITNVVEHSQVEAPPKPPENLSPSLVEVIDLVRAGADENVILKHIYNYPGSYNPTRKELSYLTALGATSSVITALTYHHTEASTADATPPRQYQPKPPAAEAVNIGNSTDPAYSQDVVKDLTRLAQSGMSADLLLSYAKSHSASHPLSSDEIIYLAQHGVPQNAISALLQNK